MKHTGKHTLLCYRVWGKEKTYKKAISAVSFLCRFTSLSIQTHKSPLNRFIEQYIFKQKTEK